MEERIKLAEEIANALRKSRYESKKSQEYMSMGIGVSKKTIQNWEKGTSCPDMLQIIEWFRLLSQNPMPLILNLSFPDKYKNIDEANNIDDVLDALIHQLPNHAKEILVFLLDGNHGSSPLAILQMLIAHLQTPLKDRVVSASVIRQNYDMNSELKRLVAPDKVQPNVKILISAIESGKKSAAQSEICYYL